MLADALAFSALLGDLARRAETAEKSKIQWVIDAKAFICKGWRGALCTFCVLGWAIRQDGKAGGTAGAGAAMLCRGYPGIGGGGSGKTAGPFWAWGRIHHPHPLPHSTAFNRPLPHLIPARQIIPASHPLPVYGVQMAAEGVPEKRAVGSLETAMRNDNRKFTGLWRDLPWPGFLRAWRGLQIYVHRWYAMVCGGDDLFSFIASARKVWY